MVAGHKADTKRKYSEIENTSHSLDLTLYLLTTGPDRNVWAMSTFANASLVELIPIFDSEEQALDLLGNLQDKTYQAASILLSKLQAIAEGRDVLFTLNPKVEIQGGQFYFREGPNWKLTIDKLNSLLVNSAKRSEQR